LFAKGDSLCASFPGVHDFVLGIPLVHTRQGFPHEVDTSRDDQAVIGQLGTTSQLHDTLVSIDAVNAVLDHLHAMTLGQVVIRGGDVGDGLAATDHQVGDGARNEGIVGLDQCDLDFVLRPHAQVFGGRGAGIAPTNDHHLGAAAATHGGTARNQSHGTQSGASLQKMTTLHGGFPYFFCAAK
jgi:hypothetical protein